MKSYALLSIISYGIAFYIFTNYHTVTHTFIKLPSGVRRLNKFIIKVEEFINVWNGIMLFVRVG